MYLLIDSDKDFNQIRPGEPIVVRADRGNVAAFLIGGERVGELSRFQPEGCVPYRTILWNIFGERILGKVAIKCGRTLVVQTDSALLTSLAPVKRVEKEGYGMLVAR